MANTYEIPTDKLEAYQKWLNDKDLQHIITENVESGFWPNFDQSKINKLFLDEEDRHLEGWAANDYDIFFELFREFEGNIPANKPTEDYLFTQANKMFFTDCERAVTMIMLLARHDYPKALVRAAEILVSGDYLDSNFLAAGRYIERAANLGYDGCYAVLAYLQATGYGQTKRDLDKARETFQQALESNNPDNYHFIAVNYCVGSIVERDTELAEKYFMKALEAGYLDAAITYFSFVHSQIIEDPTNNIMDILEELGTLGYPGAMYKIGMFFIDLASLIVPKNGDPDVETDRMIKKAKIFLTIASNKNYTQAFSILMKDSEYPKYDGRTYRLSDYTDLNLDLDPNESNGQKNFVMN